MINRVVGVVFGILICNVFALGTATAAGEKATARMDAVAADLGAVPVGEAALAGAGSARAKANDEANASLEQLSSRNINTAAPSVQRPITNVQVPMFGSGDYYGAQVSNYSRVAP